MTLQDFVNYRKIGGWLRVFQVLTIISLVSAGVTLGNTLLFSESFIQNGTFTVFSLILSVFSVLINLVLDALQLLFLSKRNKKLPQLHVIAVIVGLILMGISLLVPTKDLEKSTQYYNSLGPNAEQLLKSADAIANVSLVINVLITIALLVAWAVYFHRSQRYRVYTMTTPEFNQEYTHRRQLWEQQAAQMQAFSGQAPPYMQPQQPYGQTQPYGQPPSAPVAPNPTPATCPPNAPAETPADVGTPADTTPQQ